MIRFCDSDVWRVERNSLSKSELLSFFHSDHLGGIVCVYDNFDIECFVGIITYHSLSHAVSLDDAILKEYVLLDKDIWWNARGVFKKNKRNIREVIPLPVLNKEHQLVCFAYQDQDANREIRMLRELKETQGVLQFSDVFPEYRCVKIHGFNELAYFFAEYLSNQNIQVQVDGAMWQDFFTDEECHVPEYECLNIYAEGTWEKPYNWKENLLRSVSVEFECVDKIYEANMKNNLFKNTGEGGYSELLKRLRGEKEVILCGIGMRAQEAYDFLLGDGIEACCFVLDGLNGGCTRRLFGKRVLGLNEAICTYQDPVFIDCASKYSAWGIGNVDYYDYIGYKRNERFILLRDYVDVPENNLLNILRNTDVVLTGDRYLCGRLFEYLMRERVSVRGYLRTLKEDVQPENIPEVSTDNISESILCLIVEPSYRSDAKDGVVGIEEKKQRIVCLREKNIDNFTDYFCDEIAFINIEKDNDIKYKRECLKPKRIVLGSILSYSGNIFLRSLLDSHPSILSLYYSDLNNLLFWICVRLSMECADNILPLFWKLIEGNEEIIVDQAVFVKKMKQLLACNNRFTSQELFVMFHIAYMYMFGIDVTEDDNISSMVIYWEPHYLARNKVEKFVKWLGADDVSCDIINVVRNSIPQKGSSLKEMRCIEGGIKTAYSTALRRMSIDKREYEKSDSLVVKFEDLKCKPIETLKIICDRWDMEWSDTLLRTTRNGQEYIYYDRMQGVSGFDLKPVYNTYDNFFSELDRLKLMLVDALWQKKYSYPYVAPDQFTRRELQEMLLKEFYFEKPGDTTGFYKGRLDLDDRILLQYDLRCRVQEVRCWLSIWESII